MHRQSLQTKLATHQAYGANETHMQQQIRQFITAHPDCFERSLSIGHITGSAWIIDRDRSHVLLTHHRKLDAWFQLGGHSDGDADTLAVALREGQEESGLNNLTPISEAIFDVDIHLIPAHKNVPDHYHYDIRFLFEADRHAALTISSESNDLAWITLDEALNLSQDESIQRMVAKSHKLI